MELTKWTEEKSYDGSEYINLGDVIDNILHVTKTYNGFEFTEACDNYFSIAYSKEDALKVVDELREWINSR